MNEPKVQVWVVVEGQTEDGFVKRVLKPHLEQRGILCEPRIVTTRRSPEGLRKEGGGDWAKWKTDIRLLLRDRRPHLRVTTLFDLYGLPPDFPKIAEGSKSNLKRQRVELFEEAMANAVGDRRFIPYLQKHEFEALVLAGLKELGLLLEEREDRHGWSKLVEDVAGRAPEDINDGATTAPSKRLARFIPSYNPIGREKVRGIKGKSVYGPTVTEMLGIAQLRAKCPRFDQWVTKLEALGGEEL